MRVHRQTVTVQHHCELHGVLAPEGPVGPLTEEESAAAIESTAALLTLRVPSRFNRTGIRRVDDG